MISAIVLAAGESRRMGQQKLLLPFGECTVIEHIVDQLTSSDVGETIVVVGHDAQAVTTLLKDRPVTIVHNPDYKDGMISSVRCGIRALSPDAHAFMIVLGDQPSITTTLVNRLVAGFCESDPDIMVPKFADDTGHPIIVSTRRKGEVMTQFSDTGLRGLIYGNPRAVFELPVDAPGVLRDMDTPDDYERELKYRQN